MVGNFILFNRSLPCRREPEVSEWVRVLKGRYAGMKMIVARDKLDEVQGVRHKLCAFEMFLEKYPQFREKVGSSYDA